MGVRQCFLEEVDLGAALPETVTTSHRWPFTFTLIENKLQISSSAMLATFQAGCGYHILCEREDISIVTEKSGDSAMRVNRISVGKGPGGVVPSQGAAYEGSERERQRTLGTRSPERRCEEGDSDK